MRTWCVELPLTVALLVTETSSKACWFPHHHFKCCLAITKQGWWQIFQEEGCTGKRRACWYVRAVSLIAQPGLCYCFPCSREGNLQAVPVFQIRHLRQMVCLLYSSDSAATTLNSGIQLSSDTSARWRGEGQAHG